MKIVVDAMGGDNAPLEIVKGAVMAAPDFGADIALVGRGEDILRSLETMGVSELPANVEIVNATEVIDMEDDPALACRRKKDASMTVALRMVRDGLGDAVISAGSTGALLAGATLIVKRVHGIRRAALAPVIPTGEGGTMVIDCGANTDCTPEYLLQFAYMGSFYMEKIAGVESPRIGLLNNGAESTKGTQLQVETYKLLSENREGKKINFIGNVEAKDVMRGACDVLVCDGFSGNVLIKCIEGTSAYLLSELKGAFYANAKTKLGALLCKKEVYKLKDKFDADAFGGTALLGITKPVIKAHGSSNAKAIYNAVRQAVAAVDAGIAELIAENIDYMKVQLPEGDN